MHLADIVVMSHVFKFKLVWPGRVDSRVDLSEALLSGGLWSAEVGGSLQARWGSEAGGSHNTSGVHELSPSSM